jgi:hypothetical protein
MLFRLPLLLGLAVSRHYALSLGLQVSVHRSPGNFDSKMLLSSITLGAWFLLGPAMALTGSQASFKSSIISVNPIDASKCVAPGDYTSCPELAATTEQQCISESTTEEGKNGCGCGGFIAQMNCFAESC